MRDYLIIIAILPLLQEDEMSKDDVELAEKATNRLKELLDEAKKG